jgi:hypothetical protein
MSSVEFAGFLAGIRGEARNQIDVALAYNVLGNPRRTQIKRRLVEVFQQVLEAPVAVLRAAEVGLGIEIDIAEHPLQLRAVRILDFL